MTDNDFLHTKNKQTGKHEVIAQRELTLLDWGFRFFVDSELDAYKAAYLYKNSPAVKVEYSHNIGCWMVTVFNDNGVVLGFHK